METVYTEPSAGIAFRCCPIGAPRRGSCFRRRKLSGLLWAVVLAGACVLAAASGAWSSPADEGGAPPDARKAAAPDKLPWRPYKDGPLTAADFAAPPPDPLPEQNGVPLRGLTTAEFQTHFRYRFRFSNGVYCVTATEFTFIAAVIPGKSWNVEPDNGRLLEHEQGHFDITELFARRATRGISKLIEDGLLEGTGASEKEGAEQLIETVRKKFEPFLDAWRVEERLYDEQTRHGNDAAAQQEWRRKIQAELAEEARKSKPAEPNPAPSR